MKGRTICTLLAGTSSPEPSTIRHLVERIDNRMANNVLGDVPVRIVFSDYKDYGGVKFPSRIVQTQGGHPTLDLNVSDVQPNGAAANGCACQGRRRRTAVASRNTDPRRSRTVSGSSMAARR